MQRLVNLIVALLLALTPVAVQAHDGAHELDLLAVVNSANVQGQNVALSVTVTGLGGPLVLTGVSAAGAGRVDLDPIYVNFAQDVMFDVVLRFSAPPPAIFTLMLDFGPLGQGTVNVIPVLGDKSD